MSTPEVDLFGAEEPTPHRASRRRTTRPLPPPPTIRSTSLPVGLSPGNAFFAEAWLVDALCALGANVEHGVVGNGMSGATVTFPDGNEWTYLAVNGEEVRTEDEIRESASEAGHAEGYGEAWKEAEAMALMVAKEAVRLTLLSREEGEFPSQDEIDTLADEAMSGEWKAA